MWEPIADGELAARAWATIHDIADVVAARADGGRGPELALFWTYLATALDDDRTTTRAADAIARFASQLASETHLGLIGGLAGAGWIAAHIADDAGAVIDHADAVLVAALSAGGGPWQGQYDVVSGLAGFGVYFAGHATAAAARGLALVVAQLAATCERPREGEATWRTRVDQLRPELRAGIADTVYNCGLAHGVPGVVAALTRIAAAPHAAPAVAHDALALRDDAARWLGARRGGDGRMPSAGDGARWDPARAGWCYGDPGVDVALWGLPGAARQRWWHACSLDDARVTDAALCHGAAGLAHLANRAFHASRERADAIAARTWLAHALELGVDSLEPTLVDGSLGVALALVAAVTDLEPNWDALMLCDLPVA